MKKSLMIFISVLVILSVSVFANSFPECPQLGLGCIDCDGLDEELIEEFCDDSFWNSNGAYYTCYYNESAGTCDNLMSPNLQCSYPVTENGGTFCSTHNCCKDGNDNDCDGLVDCDDPDCYENSACREFGDAPDSTNSWNNAQMTAYPPFGPAGIAANYPTVLLAGSPPYGPCHYNYYVVLGQEISFEYEADTGYDQDSVNNIIPFSDWPDNDSVSLQFQMDDGLKHVPVNISTNYLCFAHCQQTSIPVEVTFTGGAQGPWNASLNIWIDYNRDGNWNDTVSCPPTGLGVSEWVVQNFHIPYPANLIGSAGTQTLIVNPAFIGYEPADDNWIRVQITPNDVDYDFYDGSGPGYCYEDGETEDYYVVCASTTTTVPTTTTTAPSTTTTAPVPCQTDDDCPPGQFCDNGICTTGDIPEFTTIGIVVVILAALAFYFVFFKSKEE
jgi:Cys-rich repeat protein